VRFWRFGTHWTTYRAWATYDQVIADYGAVQPFANIRNAEARHTEALASLFAHDGLPVPPNPWLGRVDRYPSVQAACEAAVAAEIANGAMYERLLGATHKPHLVAVLRRLQRASQERHLPAFQRCAQGGPAACGGGRYRLRGGRP
jgi:hypothetical protein